MSETLTRPQPERSERKLADPSLGDLSKRDYLAILVRAAKESLNDHITNLAAALAYYAFLSIPALLLVAVGVFGLVADEDAVTALIERLEGVAPQEALTLLEQTLNRVTETAGGSGLAMIVVGSVLALWTVTGAMETLMWALNSAYDREETRGFVKRRRFVTLGPAISVLAWLVASGAFAFYVSMFGSYNKAWGSLAAVIIMLTWLWISGLALIFGAEVNAESERSRELRRGEPAEVELQAPPKDQGPDR
jgi:uncharacterized BrkB/YihY/UPF0761 family membrane protein